jgi:hypothetical protein
MVNPLTQTCCFSIDATGPQNGSVAHAEPPAESSEEEEEGEEDDEEEEETKKQDEKSVVAPSQPITQRVFAKAGRSIGLCERELPLLPSYVPQEHLALGDNSGLLFPLPDDPTTAKLLEERGMLFR